MGVRAWPPGNRNGLATYGELAQEQMGINPGVTTLVGASSLVKTGLPWGNMGADHAVLAIRATLSAGGNDWSLLLEPFSSADDLNPGPLLGTGIEIASNIPLEAGANMMLVTWDQGPLPGNLYHRAPGISELNQSLNLNPVTQGPWAHHTLTLVQAGPATATIDWLSYAWRGGC